MTIITREHLKYAASGMPITVQCPGSVRMRELFPQQPTQDTMEGDAAHWAWAELLNARKITEGQASPNGVPLTDEMCEGADLFADVVQATLPYPLAQIEQLMVAKSVDPENGGSPDVWGIDTQGVLQIMEYKFGHSTIEVFRNWQMVDYAIAAMDFMGINGHSEQGLKVQFTLCQPRSYHRDGPVRVYSCLATDLRSMRNVMHGAIESSKRDSAPCFVNVECYHCSAKTHCPTLQREALARCDIAGNVETLNLQNHELALERRILERAAALIKARLAGNGEDMLSRIAGGQSVPGFIAERGTGRLRWIKPIPEVIGMGQMLGIDLAKPDAITPTQAKKAGLSEDAIKAMADRFAGELKLVADDGTRAAKVFGPFYELDKRAKG